ncbi:MAG: hypothetical protein WKF75_10895 [Singulisphaera sp.]
MPVYLQNLLYYSALIVLIGGSIIGVAFALRARRDAREGVNLTSEAEMISEFQRARDAGEMDEAEFRRVCDLLISGKNSQGGEDRAANPKSGIEGRPPAFTPPEPSKPADPE